MGPIFGTIFISIKKFKYLIIDEKDITKIKFIIIPDPVK